MTALDLALLALATLAVAYTLTKQAGPFDALARLRKRFPLGGLTSCFYCVGLWTAPALWLLYQGPGRVLVEWGAVLGLAIFAYRYAGLEHS